MKKDAVQLDLFTGKEVQAAFRREEDKDSWNKWRDVRWVCTRCAMVYLQPMSPTLCVCVKKKKAPGATFGGSGR